MRLNNIGGIVADEWQKTSSIRENVELGQWIVMPNHFHAIVHILESDNVSNTTTERQRDVETHCNASLRSDAVQYLSTNHYKNSFGSQKNNLSSIIRGFKGATTRRIRQSGFHDFAWQPRFYDRIIRNDTEVERISDYILYNPFSWDVDEYNPIS